MRLFASTGETCAQYMWYGLLERERGFYVRNYKGDDIGRTSYLGLVEERKALWEHSVQVTDLKYVASAFSSH